MSVEQQGNTVVVNEPIVVTLVLEDVIKRVNHELEQVSRITATPDEGRQKLYATAAVFNLMLILKDLSDINTAQKTSDNGAEANAELTNEIELESELISGAAKTRGVQISTIYKGIGKKIKMMHAIIKNLSRLYKIPPAIFDKLDDTQALGDSAIFTSESLELSIIGDDIHDWRIGYDDKGKLNGFGLTPVNEEQSTQGGYRKSYKHGRRSRRRHTRKNI